MSEWVLRGSFSLPPLMWDQAPESGTEPHQRKKDQGLKRARSQRGKRRDSRELVDGMEGEGPAGDPGE